MIVYEDDALKIVWHGGSSDFLLISFGDLITSTEGEEFFARRPASNLGLNCLGFVSKTRDWYAGGSVAIGWHVAQTHAARFPVRILHGCSMGGYAALKFGSLMGATAALVYCPQWSLDPAECDGFDPGWSSFFKPVMRGMGVGRADMRGRVHLLADLDGGVDQRHVGEILGRSDAVTLYPMPSSGHDITPIMAGTDNFRLTLQAVLADDCHQLRRVASTARRRSHVRLRKLVGRLRTTHPIWAANILLRRADDWNVREIARDLLEPLVFELERRGSFHLCRRLLDAFRDDIAPRSWLRLLAGLGAASGQDIYMQAFNKALLVYDRASGACRHVGDDERRREPTRYLRLGLHLHRDRVALTASGAGLHFDVAIRDGDGHLVDVLEPGAGAATWSIEHGSGATFALRNGDAYVCAELGGALACNRPSASEWETFRMTLEPCRSQRPGR